jgi:uncharacterized protein DUF3761
MRRLAAILSALGLVLGGAATASAHATHSPSSNPAGATARCWDGTYSYSEHASGTCSHHGGVRTWIHHP